MMIVNRDFTKGLLGGASIGALAIALGLPLSAQAGALPTGGHYVSGHGSINKANQSVTVKQSSTTGIINWNTFSIGAKNAVTFDNGKGATLNRVTGGNLSTIAGQLHATGSLYVMNSAGVIVSGTGKVVTGGDFVATSGNVSNTAFNSDNKFKPGADKIVNKGTIISGGSTSLAGSDVRESGTIHASSVDLSATRDLSIGGNITAQKADGSGGAVIARAHTIVIGTDGNIDASDQKAGTISIVARGTATVAGSLRAEGESAGGFIETSGEHLHVADSAHISTLATNGKAGEWLIDPQDFTIAASGGDITGATLSSELGSNNILIQSIAGAHSGNGDILVNDAVTWSSNHTLTLDAFRNIQFNAPVTITGTGGLVLIDADQSQISGTSGSNDGNAADGDLIFNNDGRVRYTDVVSGNTQGSLAINGSAFTLVNNVKKLASDIAGNGSGDYALADSYNAVNDGTYASSPIAAIFTGTFEGLGNSISNVRIVDNAGGSIGLFSEADSATLRDIALNNISIVANGNLDGANIGGLVGLADNAIIEHASVSGTMVIGSADVNQGPVVGGLVGNWSMVSNASDVSADVFIDAGANAQAGGLAGILSGNGAATLRDSHASGDVVTGANGDVGGFAAHLSDANITGSYASGMVMVASDGDVGGFAAFGNGTLTGDYATGDVFLGTGLDADAGGFAGELSGSIDRSWASGDVHVASTTPGQFAEVLFGGFIGDFDGSAITRSFATGNVTAGFIYDPVGGGFVGFANGGTSISTSYATGAVAAGSVAAGGQIGGFVGLGRGAISQSYATGAVSAGNGPIDVGGFAGGEDSSGTIDQSYSYGKATGGTSAVIGGFAGLNNNASGIGTTVADYYNKTANTGAGIGSDTATTSAVTGVTAANMFKKSSYKGWTFGKIAGGTGWVIVDSDGSLNNASSAAGGTLPMLEAEYSTTLTNAHQLELIDLDLSADYTVGNYIDASGTAGGDVWGGSGFVHIGSQNDEYSGTFDGAGNVISDLTQKNAADAFGGMFYGLGVGGVVENLGLVNVLIDNSALGGGADGALIAGFSDGELLNDYTTGKVMAGSSGYSGGLAGANDGTISHSWSSATISGTSGTAVGGLAGVNNGEITTSYATGNVAVTVGGSSFAGGLTGLNNGGTIDESYSKGIVTGAAGTAVGAFAGTNTGTLDLDYFDKTANGSTPAVGSGSSAGVTGLTSSQMERAFYFTGWTFGGLGSGADWVIVDTDASLDNAGSVSGATSPLLTDEYSTTITNAHQLQLMALNTNADYTVSNDIDASGTDGGDVWFGPGFSPIGALTEFGGSFDGEGHTISGLTITGTSGNPDVGLFAETNGNATVGGVSLNNVAIKSSTTGSVGALVGINQGAIYDVTVTGSVAGTAGDQFVGGIAGSNVGSIANSQSGVTITSTANNAGGSAGGIAGSNIGLISSDTASGSVHVDGDDIGAGGLIGINSGTITESFATAAVTVTDAHTTSGNAIGGLVGINDGGSITLSYATGTASGSGGADAFAGGFVGINENGGAIANSYAMGAATGSLAGGFVGLADGGSIKYAYSTGVVTGTHASGFAGTTQSSPVFADDYWDISTSGVTKGSVAGTFAKTTAALQAGLLTGLNASNWSIVAGASFPYLNWQFSGGTPQVVSGIIYAGYAGAPAEGEIVNVDTTGADLTPALSAASGADGYFYVLLNPSSFGSNASLLAYAGGQGGATFVDNASNTGAIGGLRIYGGFLNDATSDTAYSTIATDLSATQGTTGALVLAGLPNLLIDTSKSSSFNIDQSIDTHDLIIVGDGDQSTVIQGGGTISADGLLLLGGSAFSLQDANAIGTLAGTTGQLDVASNSLTIGTVEGISGVSASAGVQLTTTSGQLSITRQLNAASQSVSLVSAGAISESGSGFINASSLTGSSVGATSLNSVLNTIADLGPFTATGGFAFTDDRSLTLNGDISSSTSSTTQLTTVGAGHAIVIDAGISTGTLDLVSSGSISENDSVVVNAKILTGSSTNSTVLNSGSNVITDLGAFTTGGNAAFELTDDHGLTTHGAISTGTGTLDLTTVGSGNSLAIDSAITGGTVNLVVTGEARESSAGAITASKLNATANTGIKLTSAKNNITKLGTDKTNSGPNKVTL